ncbi:hypothetical protein QEZ54_32340 [Catellatospora sp. KI3]|uniref:hypothetical protein n=1 Tax=Catellatospora sp. KI3 TaxID=3041620 RepID=UPI002482F1D2|nr:hypothetical protein [Catellatospora sp. KI3]MDI1465671.1 hypothetical protein [Catellatospora sp. KI3]
MSADVDSDLDPHAVGERVQARLDEVERAGGPAARAAADDAVRELMLLHQAALTRLLHGLTALPGNAAVLPALAADELVGGLLALYDLHPVPVTDRVAAALPRVAGKLGREVALLGVDADGVAHVALTASGCGGGGCGGSAAAVADALTRAVQQAAPEVVEVRVQERVAPAPLLQIGRRDAGVPA